MLNRYKTIIITILITSILMIFIQWLAFRDNIKILIKFNEVFGLIDDNFYFDFDKDNLLDYALTGMTLGTDDPYTNYYSKNNFRKYLDNIENSYIGVGAIIGATDDNKYLEIISTMENSSSEKAGLIGGDIILEVNGKLVYADDLNYVANILRGENDDIGDTVTFKIIRNDETFNVSLKIDSVKKDSVTSKILENNIGYIKISGFDRKNPNDKSSIDTYDEFIEEIARFEEEKIDKLIIDLRNNPGGDFDVVTKIADYILPEGIITYTEDKNNKKDYVYSDKDCLDAKIVVLANEGSASASEVLIGALKDYNKATVVGTKTYGKGIVQNIYHFKDGSGLSLTTSRYFSPNGTCIHKTGIEPDYHVELPDDTNLSKISTNDDTQLFKAIEFLKHQ